MFVRTMCKPINEKGLKLLPVKPHITIKVVPSGFEPEQTEPKSVVLPLHHGTLFGRLFTPPAFLA